MEPTGGPICVQGRRTLLRVFSLPPDDTKYGYTYPVVAFDHNPPPGQPPCKTSGHAVVGGFVYQGTNVPELRGKYLFADFVPGRVFYADTQEMHAGGKLATIYELALFTDTGQPVTMEQLAGGSRTDVRFGTDGHGELYVLSKANGKIWKITGTRRS